MKEKLAVVFLLAALSGWGAEAEKKPLAAAAMGAVKGEVPASAADFVPPSHDVAVFGGSFSVIPETRVAKDAWRRKINCTVSDFGIGGCGFVAGREKQNDVPNQVARALATGVKFDLFVLWASTNDIWGRDVAKQDAGIEKAVALIREKAPTAKVVFFTSMPIPLKAKENELLGTFVAGQVKTCERLGVPCLDLYAKSGITAENAAALSGKDRFHPNEAGYAKVKDLQADFLASCLVPDGKGTK